MATLRFVFLPCSPCLMSEHHNSVFAGGFLPFVEKQCVQYGGSGNVLYDFKKAEQYLLDVYFSGKPLIDLEV